jgi:uncharacterized protein
MWDLTNATLSDEVNAVRDGQDELLGPIVCLHHVVEFCHCSAIIIYRIEDPTVPQSIGGKYQAAVSQNHHRHLDLGQYAHRGQYLQKEQTMANPFVHVELHTRDPEKAEKFYKELFDWKFEDVPDKDYTVINVGDGTGGGIMKSPMPPDARPQWVPYVLVDDVEASTEKAKSLGARVLIEIMEVPDMGRFSMFLDPTGAAFALWQPKMPA